ncbi:hypothetical protein BYT27DRAFT_7217842 [Phlegmacium glaucopus]|nr:hypothetical protein BYT27DRAFT_7217842 [Phlegmacium glaucopus]
MDPCGLKLHCARCRLYCGVATGVLDDLQDICHHLHGLEVSFEGRADMTAQWATGFQQLHEAVLMKEIEAGRHQGTAADVNPAEDATQKNKKIPMWPGKQSAQLRAKAKANLTHLQNLPNLKWTWGSDLTKDDVLQLVPEPSNPALGICRVPP